MLVFEERGKPEYPEKNLSNMNSNAKTFVRSVFGAVFFNLLKPIFNYFLITGQAIVSLIA